MVKGSGWSVVEITAILCGAGASPPLGAVKLKVLRESSTPAAGGLMVSENDLVAVALVLSVARITNENAPAAWGVPVKVPAALSSETPAGRVPESTAQVTGGD